MRKLTDVIDQVLLALPNPAPVEVADELIILRSELRILRRATGYTAPEASTEMELWSRLGTTLYRYMPGPAAYPWAQQIADILNPPVAP